ncbi:hypothetical protein [Burkholderia aenigmatica]|uniref:hypothetical protein n=1 Tax=Burkholderia aenigmatica TaxID=2015348 RepID=UPI00264F4BF3|nr:hypothetical protein [Burkholderia aenigmatica]MDN7880057.1 hypothetical protein [Burkholderia aenigmatica]
MKDHIKKFIAATLAYLGLTAKQQTPASTDEPQNYPSGAPGDALPTTPTRLPSETKLWNPPPALSREELAYTVKAIATGIHVQQSSPIFAGGAQPDVFARLESIHAALHTMPAGKFFPETPAASEMDVAERIHQAGVRRLPQLPDAGETRIQVANALYGFACALKTQAIASPALSTPDMQSLSDELSSRAGQLVALSGDVCIARSNKHGMKR